MKTSSAKAKGRRFQQWVRDQLIEHLNVHPEDIESRSMGAGGEDLIMARAAREKFPYSIECKNQEKVNLILMAKKNLKRSDLVIGDKSYSFYKIIWEDITGDSTIASSDDFNKMKTSIIVSYAYIYKKDNKYLWTFASYSDDGFFGDRNIIPVGLVKSITQL